MLLSYAKNRATVRKAGEGKNPRALNTPISKNAANEKCELHYYITLYDQAPHYTAFYLVCSYIHVFQFGSTENRDPGFVEGS